MSGCMATALMSSLARKGTTGGWDYFHLSDPGAPRTTGNLPAIGISWLQDMRSHLRTGPFDNALDACRSRRKRD
jgi:hypothetical protein